jgi:Fe-S cluster biogenesis protein NfuA
MKIVSLHSKLNKMEHSLLTEKVKSIIEQIRPYLQADGGDIEFVELTPDNVVRVKLQGACGTCPHAKVTLKQGVESTIKEHLPEIVRVEDIVLGF